MDAILFDWMGVIFRDADVIGTVFPRILGQEMQRCGLSLEEMCARYYPYSEGKLSREAFWQGFHGNIDGLEREYLDAFQLNEGCEYVRGLQERFRLGVVSNLPHEWGEYLIQKYRFRDLFDPIVVSGSVRRRKPDPEIYRIALRGLGAVGRVYVVDDKTSNLRVAEQELSMTAVWMRSQPANSDFVPHLQIDRLTDLEEILSR